MITPTIATKENSKAASIIILSLLQWEDHIDFGKNLGQRTPLMNRSDKKNDDCGISAARHQTLRIGRLPPPACAAIARPLETGAVASGDDRPVDPAPLACSVPASRIALRACSTTCSNVDPASAADPARPESRRPQCPSPAPDDL